MTSHKLAFLPALALVATVLGTAPVAFAATPTVEIDVMTHLCNPNIKNQSDFDALSAGKSPLAGFANRVLNCPTTVLPANAPVAGAVASPQTPFNYTVTGEHSNPLMLSSSMYHPESLCESAINVDVNGDGKVSSSTCLDTSEYHFNTVSADNGKATVQETTPPQGFHFGALLLTPVQVDGNNDAQSVLATDPVQGLIKLDTTNDTDKIITLHVYDFANSDNPQGLVNGMPASVGPTGTGSGMGTTTGTSTPMTLVAQIQALEMQIQNLEAQISALLSQLLSA